MNRPDRYEYLMRMAVVTSSRGTCNRASVGAIIAREGRIISTGYVGAPSGEPHCLDVGCDIEEGGCIRTVHAEANAITFAARFGHSVDGGELVCTHAPCLGCAKLIVNSGIRHLVYEHPYRLSSGLELLDRAGVTITHLPSPEVTVGPMRVNERGVAEPNPGFIPWWVREMSSES